MWARNEKASTLGGFFIYVLCYLILLSISDFVCTAILHLEYVSCTCPTQDCSLVVKCHGFYIYKLGRDVLYMTSYPAFWLDFTYIFHKIT